MNTLVYSARPVLMVLLLAACTKKAADALAPAPPLGMSWTDSGRTVKTTAVSLGFSQSILNGPDDISILAGTAFSDTTGVELFLPRPLAVGTYAVAGSGNPGPGTATGRFSVSTIYGLSPVYRATGGTVTVTDATNGTVSGTFSFTAACTSSLCNRNVVKTITNGVFRLR